jgi:predicted ArsR family transcriptional regulator
MPRSRIGETRLEIVLALKQGGKMSAKELAERLGISAVAVRSHLAQLESESLVEVELERRDLGRPVQRYSVTSGADDLIVKDYSRFVVEILDLVGEVAGKNVLDKVFKERSRRLAKRYLPVLAEAKPSEKIDRLAQILDEHGYMPSISEDGRDLLVSEFNCPLSEVAKHYPHLCDYEFEMLRELTGCEVEREDHLLRGDHCCRYRIKNAASRNGNVR